MLKTKCCQIKITKKVFSDVICSCGAHYIKHAKGLKQIGAYATRRKFLVK